MPYWFVRHRLSPKPAIRTFSTFSSASHPVANRWRTRNYLWGTCRRSRYPRWSASILAGLHPPASPSMPAIQTRLDFKPELDANSADACGPAGEATLALDVLGRQSKTRKILLLGILCLALFLDTFNNSSLFTAIPVISVQLDIPNSQSVWLLSAYQLTFAALLLIVSISCPHLKHSRLKFCSERQSERFV